jgi:hypothetical protein
MKNTTCIVVFILLTSVSGLSQDVYWQAGLNTFFDNIEFGGSSVKIPQTLTGVRFSPGMGIRWDSIHRINAGLSMLHEFGSPGVIDKVSPTAYYELHNGPVRFMMGAFPRSGAIDNYPRLFFQDSVNYYRPNVNGIFFEAGRENNYANIWLDWTGRQSVDVRETFFIGTGGRYSFGPVYLRHFGFMYHFSGTSDPAYDEALHDNALFLNSAGIDLSGRWGLDKLDINAGWAVGIERARGEGTGWVTMNGLLTEVKAEFRFIGILNSFYTGDRLFAFYNDHSNELYWGDPAYRAGTYNRSDFYIDFFKDRNIRFRLTYSLHALEGRVYHEQMLRIGIDLERFW